MFKFSSNTLDSGFVQATPVNAIKPTVLKPVTTGPFSVAGLATSQNQPQPIDALRNAIGGYETKNVKNPYSFSQPAGSGTPKNTAMGRYQVTTDELNTYGSRYLGKVPTPQEFLSSPQLQDKYMTAKIQDQRKQGIDDNNIIANHRGGINAKVEDRQGYIGAVRKELPSGFQFSTPTLGNTSQASAGFDKTVSKPSVISKVVQGIPKVVSSIQNTVRGIPLTDESKTTIGDVFDKFKPTSEEEAGKMGLVNLGTKENPVYLDATGFVGELKPIQEIIKGLGKDAIKKIAQSVNEGEILKFLKSGLKGIDDSVLKPLAKKLVTTKTEQEVFKELTSLVPINAPVAPKTAPGEAIVPKAGEYQVIHQGGVTKTVKGEPVKIIDGVDTFVHLDENGNWAVSEVTTGRNLTGGGYENKNFALKAAKENLDAVGEIELKKLISENQLPNQAKKEIPSVRTAEIPTTELKQSQLATENLTRSVAKQEPIPAKSRVSSLEDSITQPIVNKQEAKDALIKSTIKEPKNPQLVAGADKFKDISGFKGQARDVYRNFKAFFGNKFETVKKTILDPFDASKGAFVDEQKKLLDELRAKVVNNGIKKGSKESAAVMDYGEKLITKDELIKKFGTDKADKIIEADKWFRSKYDALLEEVNAVRAKIYPKDPTKIIPKRQDYYRHFQELGGLEGLKNIFETPAGIDPMLSGISPFTKPRSKFLSFAQRRLGLQSERDAVGGFLEYVPSFSYAKHIDPQIGNFRTLANDLALATQESRNANNFIEFLQDFANDLSGKTNAADRFVQKVIPGGRKAFGVINWLNKRVKANTILGNASSSIAQIFNVPQGIASAKLYSGQGVLKTVGSIFAKNEPMLKSTFIKERYANSMFTAFDQGILAQPKKFAVWTVSVLDELGTKFIWNAHYAKALAKNISNPIKYADDITRSLVAGRGVGEVPLLQKSKVFQIFAPFQLEVGNLWYVMGDQVKAKDFSGLATLFVSSYLFNRVAEQIRGSDVSFDPLNAVYEGIQSLQQEKDKKVGVAKLAGRIGGEVLSNIPGGQTLASMYPEYGLGALGGVTRKELFGEGDPTRFGSGLFAIKGLQDPLFKVLPAFGGSQIKKTIEGTKAFSEGKVTNKSGKTMFKIDKTPANAVRSVLFGKYSSPEARQSFKPKTSTKGTFKFKSSGL